MTRTLLLTGAALLLGAASPQSFPPLAMVTPFGAPLPAPDAPSDGFTPAPVPNQELDAPHGRHAPDNAGKLSPRLALPSAGSGYQGDGYTRGSSYNLDQERRFRPAPTLNLSLPVR